MVVLVPLVFDPGGLQVFLPLKWALGLGLVGTGLAVAAWHGRLPDLLLLSCWVPLLAVVLVAAVVGVAPLSSLIGGPGRNLGAIAWLGFAMAFALGLAVGRQASGVRLVALALLSGSMIVSAYALLQALGVDPVRWDEAVDVSRARSTLGNAEHLGGYLVLVLPVALALGTDRKEVAWCRGFSLVAALSGATALLATGTRGAWVGAVAALSAGAWLARDRLRALRPHSWWIAAGALVIVAGSLLTPIANRALSSFDLDRGTVGGRLAVYEASVDLVLDRPILGSGPDSFAIVFPRVASSKVIQTIGEERVADRAHNLILDTLVQTGVAGLLALGWLLWSVRRQARRTWESSLGLGIVLGLVAYVVHLQFAFQLADLDLVVWLLAGCGVGLGQQSPPAAVRSKVTAAPSGRRLLVAGGLALAGLTGFSWSVREAFADRHLRSALEAEGRNDPQRALDEAGRATAAVPERVFYQAARAEVEQRIGYGLGDLEVLEQAAATARRAERMQPNDLELVLRSGEIALARAEVLAAAGDGRAAAGFEAAEASLRRASQLGPASARAALRLGVALVQQDKQADAEAAWRRSATIAPDAPGPWLNLGLLYVQQRRHVEARSALGTALRLDPANKQAEEALLGLPT